MWYIGLTKGNRTHSILTTCIGRKGQQNSIETPFLTCLLGLVTAWEKNKEKPPFNKSFKNVVFVAPYITQYNIVKVDVLALFTFSQFIQCR